MNGAGQMSPAYSSGQANGSARQGTRCPPFAISEQFYRPDTPAELKLTRSRTCYRQSKQVGQGAYGSVFLAEDVRTGAKVALKRIDLNDNKGENQGVTITTLREISHLFKVQHENVVKLKEVVYGGQTVSTCSEVLMVLEYAEHDLQGVHQRIKDGPGRVFRIADVKAYMEQLLRGLSAMHHKGILHRDLKSANLLITREGVLKIADFGLSRQTVRAGQQGGELTPQVCTLWYRPPELLLAGRSRLRYGPDIDIWSAGCIFAELLAGSPFFGKDTETDALYAICKTCGSPDPVDWPEVTALPGWEACRKEFKQSKLRTELLRKINDKRRNQTPEDRAAIQEALGIIEKMLSVTPRRRPTAKDVFANAFFSESAPHPTPRAELEGLGGRDGHSYAGEHQRNRPPSPQGPHPGRGMPPGPGMYPGAGGGYRPPAMGAGRGGGHGGATSGKRRFEQERIEAAKRRRQAQQGRGPPPPRPPPPPP